MKGGEGDGGGKRMDEGRRGGREGREGLMNQGCIDLLMEAGLKNIVIRLPTLWTSTPHLLAPGGEPPIWIAWPGNSPSTPDNN